MSRPSTVEVRRHRPREFGAYGALARDGGRIALLLTRTTAAAAQADGDAYQARQDRLYGAAVVAGEPPAERVAVDVPSEPRRYRLALEGMLACGFGDAEDLERLAELLAEEIADACLGGGGGGCGKWSAGDLAATILDMTGVTVDPAQEDLLAGLGVDQRRAVLGAVQGRIHANTRHFVMVAGDPWSVETPEEVERARVAMRAAHLSLAPVWIGRPALEEAYASDSAALFAVDAETTWRLR